MTVSVGVRSARGHGSPVGSPASPVGGATPDGVLITAARHGDLYAWETLVRRHQGFAFRCACLVTRDAEVAEEATKLAFVRAYRGLPTLEAEARFRPWLMGIVASISRAKKREIAQQRDARFVEPQHSRRLRAEWLASSVVTPHATALERDALIAAFDRLGDDDRVIVASRYVLGLTRGEIVAYLGIGEDEVDDRLRAAVGRLRTQLASV